MGWTTIANGSADDYRIYDPYVYRSGFKNTELWASFKRNNDSDTIKIYAQKVSGVTSVNNYRVVIKFSETGKYNWTTAYYYFKDEYGNTGSYVIEMDDFVGSNLDIKLEIQAYILNPPSTPSNIIVPTIIKGGESILVSWGSSSNATRYHLERQVNEGSYTQVYSGSSRSYTDTALSTWNTVRYRVKAYNSDGYSSYRYSDTITVTHFPEMGLKVDGTLKTSEMGWVKIDGVLKEIDSIWTKVDGILKEV